MSRTFLPHVITDDSALGGAVIERSLRFDNTNTGYLNRTAGTSTSQYKFTFSAWVKLGRTVEATTDYGELFNGYAGSNNNSGFGAIYFYNGGLRFAGWSTTYRATSRLFRDAGAWYHIVVAVDSTLGTADNRQKIYINGVEETSFSTSNNLGQNDTFGIGNNSTVMQIGRDNSASSDRSMDGYMSEINFVDGQQLDPSYFGFTDSQTGIWLPKRYEGTYGNNGFHLEFKDNSSTSALGKDTSGNENDFTTNNFSVSTGTSNDSVEDTPTNNWATLNPLHWNILKGAGGTSNGPDFTRANLRFVSPSSVTSPYNRSTGSTIEVSSGKWYYEVTVETLDNGVQIGFSERDAIDSNGYWTGYWSYNYFDQRRAIDGTEASYGAKASAGNIIGCAFDLDQDTMEFFVNNSSQGKVTGLGISGKTVVASFTLAFWTNKIVVNFGQQGFAYTPPAGFKALCAKNLPPNASSIVRPQRHFDPLLYTGTGSSNIVEGLEFSPDMIWVKGRDTNGTEHMIIDTVRGGNNSLVPNSSDAESTHGGRSMTFYPGGVRWNSDSNTCNANGENYAMWCWKAGGSSNTYNIDGIGYGTAAAAGLDGGTTDPTGASVNTENGFGIYTYTGNGTAGANIAHGLGKKPAWILIKSRSASSKNWVVYHHANTDNPSNVYLELSGTDANADETEIFNDTEPTSSLITIGDDGKVNQSSVTYVMYVWTEIPGYSNFGKYKGSGSSDGTTVLFDFRPAFLILKRTDDSKSWVLFDSKRSPSNLVDKSLYPNRSDGDNGLSNLEVDFLSNGFKIRNSVNTINGQGNSYVYLAFAEKPGGTAFDMLPNSR